MMKIDKMRNCRNCEKSDVEYKVSTGTKITYICNAVLTLTAIVVGNDIAFGVSVIIFVILSAEVRILEAIHFLKNQV